MDFTQNGAIVPSGGNAVVPATGSGAIAPVSGSNNIGIRRAEIKQGIREVILCKDNDGKIGLRVRAVNKGIFVAFVHANSPAALGGLRFGDQILQIDGENVAGFDTDKAMKKLKNASPQRVVFAIRDRQAMQYFWLTVSERRVITSTFKHTVKNMQ